MMPLGVGEEKNDFALLDKCERTTRTCEMVSAFVYKLVLLDVFFCEFEKVQVVCMIGNTRSVTRTVINLYKTKCLKSRYCPICICGIFRVWVYKIQLDRLDNQPTVLPILTRCLHISYRSRWPLVSLFWYCIIHCPFLVVVPDFWHHSWQVCNCNNATSLKRKLLRWIVSPFALGFPWLHSLCVMIYLQSLFMSLFSRYPPWLWRFSDPFRPDKCLPMPRFKKKTSSIQFALNSLRIENPQASLVLPRYRL